MDLANSLFVLEKTDLVLPDVIPLALTRTYRQNDPARRAFGIGSTHPYDMYLWSEPTSSTIVGDILMLDTSALSVRIQSSSLVV